MRMRAAGAIRRYHGGQRGRGYPSDASGGGLGKAYEKSEFIVENNRMSLDPMPSGLIPGQADHIQHIFQSNQLKTIAGFRIDDITALLVQHR